MYCFREESVNTGNLAKALNLRNCHMYMYMYVTDFHTVIVCYFACLERLECSGYSVCETDIGTCMFSCTLLCLTLSSALCTNMYLPTNIAMNMHP